MLLLFSIMVAEWPSVWERADYSIYRACLRERLSVCMLRSLYFEGGTRNSIVLLPDHCQYFTLYRNAVQVYSIPTLMCLSIGTPKKIKFPFVPNGKVIILGVPNLGTFQPHYNELEY